MHGRRNARGFKPKGNEGAVERKNGPGAFRGCRSLKGSIARVRHAAPRLMGRLVAGGRFLAILRRAPDRRK